MDQLKDDKWLIYPFWSLKTYMINDSDIYDSYIYCYIYVYIFPFLVKLFD